jgi:hypothetical protein
LLSCCPAVVDTAKLGTHILAAFLCACIKVLIVLIFVLALALRLGPVLPRLRLVLQVVLVLDHGREVLLDLI